MIKIAISTEAFAAIVATMPLGTVAFEQDLNGMGQRRVWLAVAVADRLSAMRRADESYSDVILRLVEVVDGR